MTQQVNADQESASREGRVRIPRNPLPTMKFEETLRLPKSVAEYGLDGEIKRLTLFKELSLSPESGPSRTLVTNSGKYGLTAGGNHAVSLSVTDNGRVALDADGASRKALEMRFQLAIGQFEPFNTIYEKLKDKPFQEGLVLKDELGKAGVAESDRDKAAEVFVANLRFLGLVDDIGGKNYVRTIDDALEKLPKSAEEDITLASPSVESPVVAVSQVRESGKIAAGTKRPALHVDIQVHIDPTSSAEQIDQIFASMARHLYGNES